MAFGQQSGPPATGKQVRELQELLEAAGHTDFRDARGPMGFTQRQAGGKFSRDEADAFIEQLQNEAFERGGVPDVVGPSPATSAARRADVVRQKRPSKAEQMLMDVSDELLAAELQRRGWIVVEG